MPTDFSYISHIYPLVYPICGYAVKYSHKYVFKLPSFSKQKKNHLPRHKIKKIKTDNIFPLRLSDNLVKWANKHKSYKSL